MDHEERVRLAATVAAAILLGWLLLAAWGAP